MATGGRRGSPAGALVYGGVVPETTISPEADVVTLINVFTCPAERQDELVAALDRATAEIFAGLPGFVSANIHASLDKTRVVNYAQWRSVRDFDAMQRRDDVRKHMGQIMAIAVAADPRLFQVRVVHHG